MLRIVTDQKNAPIFCNWLATRFPAGTCDLNPQFTRTIGFVEFSEPNAEGQVAANILCVAAFHNWSDKAVEITVASNGEKRKKASHEFIWTYFNYVFQVCDKTCLYATIAIDNDKCLALAEATGYSKTGLLPDYFGDNKDAFVYAITRSQWEKGRFAQKEPIEINTQIASGKENNNRETVH